MPRIVYVIVFLVITLLPFPFLWVGQMVAGTKQPTSTHTATNQYGTRQHHHYHRSYGPGWGWFIFHSGSSGRGGWLSRSYRNYNSGSSYSTGNRSYKGGTSSFKGGSFGGFGK